MIDYIKLTVDGEFPPVGKLTTVERPGGFVTESFTADAYRLFGDGADYHLKLRKLKAGGQSLDVDFCPAKILQGHNGFGSNDLLGVVWHAVKRIFQDRDIPLTRDVKSRLQSGDYRLREVHIAELHSMPHAAIPALCRQIRRYGPDSLQAVPLEKGIGVRLWPNSRSRRVLIYDKLHFFQDVTPKKPHKHLDILTAGIPEGSYARIWQSMNMNDLMEYLKQGVRIECRLLSPFLKTRQLDRGSAWTVAKAREIYQEVLREVPLGDMPLASTVDRAIVEAPPAQKSLIALWADGRNPSEFFPRSTFYRLCKAIWDNYRLDITRPILKAPNAVTWPSLVEPKAIVATAPKWARADGFAFSPKHPTRSSKRT